MNSSNLIEKTKWGLADMAIVYLLLFSFLSIAAIILLFPIIQAFLNLHPESFMRISNDLLTTHWLRYGLYGIVEQLMFSVIPIVWVTARKRGNLKLTWFASGKLSQDFLVGILIGLLIRCLAYLPRLLYNGTSSYERFLINMTLDVGAKFMWLEFIRTVIIGPIGETILFIGFTFPILSKKLHTRIGACLTALIFAVSHCFGLQEFNAAVMMWLFVIGIVSIVLFKKRRSIIAPIGFHAAYNLFFIVFFVVEFGRISAETPAATVQRLFEQTRQANWHSVKNLISANTVDEVDTVTLDMLFSPDRISSIKIDRVNESPTKAQVLITLETSGLDRIGTTPIELTKENSNWKIIYMHDAFILDGYKPIDNPSTYIKLGSIYSHAGRYYKAIDSYNKALLTDSYNMYTHWGLGYCYAQLGRYNDAQYHFEQAVRAAPTQHELLSSLGLTYGYLEQDEKAIEAFTRSIHTNPDVAQTYVYRGYAFIKIRAYDRAIMDFQSAAKLEPRDVYALIGSAISYFQLGNAEGAIEIYRGVLDIDSNYANISFIESRPWAKVYSPYEHADIIKKILSYAN